MKKKLFIGFSQVNGSEIAIKVKNDIESSCGWIKCELWNNGKAFPLNDSTLNSLIVASRKYEYGVFIATQDDKVKETKREVLIPRDNVVFEMGLFVGSMGIERSFIMVEKGSKLPSDFKEITVPFFEKGNPSSTSNATEKIINRLKNNRQAYGLRPIPSATLALGYFDNFLEPFARLRKKEDSGRKYEIKIILPENINYITDKSKFYELIDKYEEINESEDVSVYNDNKRPVIKRLKSNKNIFWDIPTTLNTLKKLFDKVYPAKNVIGNDIDSDEWIKDEVNNFVGAMSTLIEKDISFMNLKVCFYWLEYKKGSLEEVPVGNKY